MGQGRGAHVGFGTNTGRKSAHLGTSAFSHKYRWPRVEVVDADQSGDHFASDVFEKSSSSVASDIAGRTHPRSANLGGSNHRPGNFERWYLLDEGYGKQSDIIGSMIMERMRKPLPCVGRIMKLAGEST